MITSVSVSKISVIVHTVCYQRPTNLSASCSAVVGTTRPEEGPGLPLFSGPLEGDVEISWSLPDGELDFFLVLVGLNKAI